MTKSPITKTGAERLREQLHELKTVERPRITAAIAEARAHGCLLYTSPSPRDRG